MKNMDAFLNDRNQPKPQPPFQEPDLKSLDDFITYCSIFDPTISTQSGRFIDRANLLFCDRLYRDELIINLFNKFSDIRCAIEVLENFILFICDAPLYSENPKEYSLEIIEDRFSKKPKLNTSWKNLKNSQVHSLKTYAYLRGSFDNETFQSWLILKTPTKNTKYAKSPKNIMGYGNTLPEADLEFHKARIKTFTNSQIIIDSFIEQKIPLTKQRMFDTCKKIDPMVNPNTVTFAYHENGFSYIELSYFELSCQSNTHKFTLNVGRQKITWEVVKILAIEDEEHPVNINFLGKGKTLQEAINMCEFQYQKCINNNNKIAEKIALKQQEEIQQSLMIDNLEGEEFFNELIAEYGEDIFPDRD